MRRPKQRAPLLGVLVATWLLVGATRADSAETAQQRGRRLVSEVVKAVGGGLSALRARVGVEYEYTYRLPNGKANVSLERYLFDGELSWAKYTKRGGPFFPQLKGEVVQGYDGKRSWMTDDGRPVTDAKLLKMADFLRKTNFYWFAMMHKLTDPGTHHTSLGKRQALGKSYDVVELSFSQGVGDVQDKYLLYINPKTNLIDQFLFTVMDFGKATPFLMRVEYATIDGLKLPITRRYAASDWSATIAKDAKWTDELMRKVRFSKTLARDSFSAPSK